jgi:hypothetical protein
MGQPPGRAALGITGQSRANRASRSQGSQEKSVWKIRTGPQFCSGEIRIEPENSVSAVACRRRRHCGRLWTRPTGSLECRGNQRESRLLTRVLVHTLDTLCHERQDQLVPSETARAERATTRPPLIPAPRALFLAQRAVASSLTTPMPKILWMSQPVTTRRAPAHAK